LAYGNLPISAADLRALSKKELDEALSKLTPKQAEEILYTWELWARPNQLEPVQLRDGEKDFWVFNAGRGAGKLVRKDTPLLTTKGWKTVGEVEVGEYIFDENGKPTEVIKTFDDTPKKAYRLHFSDGSHIDCCDEHQWVTWTHRDRKAYNRSEYESGPLPEDWPNWKPKKIIGNKGVSKEVVEEALKLRSKGMSVRRIEKALNVTRLSLTKHLEAGRYVEREPKVDDSFINTRVKLTQDIVNTFRQGKRGDLNHSIPLAKPIEFPEENLKIDPYIFGYWLGDGYKRGSTITCDPSDQESLEKYIKEAGYETGNVASYKAISVLGLITRIKEEGALDKVIPEKYRFGSKDQRLAILQGLMDSGGYADHSSVEFTAVRKDHAEYVMWLARSLGQKPVLSEGRATLNGEDYGPKYRVTWRPAHKINPFRIPRKADKVTFGGNQESRNHHRMIVDYEEIEPVPMRCFTVDSPNSLFLVGEALIPTHNTKAGAEWVRHRIKSGDKRIACVAPTNSDIRRVMVEGESGLLNVCWKNDKTYRGGKMGYPEWSPTNRTLTWENGAKAEFFSAEDPERLRGPQFFSAWCDELRAWRNMRDTWDMLQFCLRLGKHPKTLVTTTPKPVRLMRELLASDRAVISSGSTYDNLDNLAPTFIRGMQETYETWSSGALC